MDSIEKKRQKEQCVVEEMIRLYCRKNHKEYDKTTGKMCPSCQELSDYARLRSQKCPFMEEKTFCANCKVHCYKPERGRRFGRLCGFPDRGCFCIIRHLQCGI